MQSLIKLSLGLLFLGMFLINTDTAEAQTAYDSKTYSGTMNNTEGDDDDDDGGIKIPPRVAPDDNGYDNRLSGFGIQEDERARKEDAEAHSTRRPALLEVMQMEFILPNQRETATVYVNLN